MGHRLLRACRKSACDAPATNGHIGVEAGTTYLPPVLSNTVIGHKPTTQLLEEQSTKLPSPPRSQKTTSHEL